MDNFVAGLGIKGDAEFFNYLYDLWPEFRNNTLTGFAKYNAENQPLTVAIRRCIVDIALKNICGEDRTLKIKLATLRPDLTTDIPWKVAGVSEREQGLIETYLVSGSDPKTVAEKILENSKLTPWRYNAVTRTSEQTGRR